MTKYYQFALIYGRKKELLSRSSLEHLISLDLVGTKLYCFRDRLHCYHCMNIIFSINPVRRSKELRGGPERNTYRNLILAKTSYM